jgi:hypothetical protein
VSTSDAAKMLGYSQATLRHWSCDGSGPIQPVKFGQRGCRWRINDIRELMGLAPLPDPAAALPKPAEGGPLPPAGDLAATELALRRVADLSVRSSTAIVSELKRVRRALAELGVEVA